MNRFFFDEKDKSGNFISVFGDDVNHIKNVLRLREGDEAELCNGEGTDYLCRLSSLADKNSVIFEVLSVCESESELPVRIVLYQGIPKKDKMDLIVQKNVELGVSEFVPVAMKRCIVKIEDPKSEQKKIARWQEIARAAAKQSGRGIIPEVKNAISYKEALTRAFEPENSIVLVPYENAEGMKSLTNAINEIKSRVCAEKNVGKISTVSVFIGPEGGFDEGEISEIEKRGAKIVSLGHRILRTETAGFTTAAIIMYELETI